MKEMKKKKEYFGMKKIVKMFGNQKKFRDATGLSLRTSTRYCTGETPMEFLNFGTIIKIAQGLGMTEQQVIDILLKRERGSNEQ